MWDNHQIYYREENVTHPWELQDLRGRRIGQYQTFQKAERAACGVYGTADGVRHSCLVCDDQGCEHCPKVRAA